MANINLTLVTCTEVLFKYWDLVAAIYHARDDWLKYGIVNGQGLHINTKLVIPWMADDELELAIKHNHGVFLVAFIGRVWKLQRHVAHGGVDALRWTSATLACILLVISCCQSCWSA